MQEAIITVTEKPLGKVKKIQLCMYIEKGSVFAKLIKITITQTTASIRLKKSEGATDS